MQYLKLLLYLLMARPMCTDCGVLHSSPVISLAPTAAGMLLSLVGTGSQRELGSPKTEDVPQMNPSEASGRSIPAPQRGTWASRHPGLS